MKIARLDFGPLMVEQFTLVSLECLGCVGCFRVCTLMFHGKVFGRVNTSGIPQQGWLWEAKKVPYYS